MRRDIFDLLEDVMRFPLATTKSLLERLKEPYFETLETAEEVYLWVELPGVGKDAISVDVTEDSVEVKVKGVEKGFYKPRFSGFEASYKLPTKIELNSVRANYRDGVLEVRAKKGAAKGRRVKID